MICRIEHAHRHIPNRRPAPPIRDRVRKIIAPQIIRRGRVNHLPIRDTRRPMTAKPHTQERQGISIRIAIIPHHIECRSSIPRHADDVRIRHRLHVGCRAHNHARCDHHLRRRRLPQPIIHGVRKLRSSAKPQRRMENHAATVRHSATLRRHADPHKPQRIPIRIRIII